MAGGTVRDEAYLKSKFEAYDEPTEEDFSDLIRTMFYRTSSGNNVNITGDASGSGTSNITLTLASVNANVFASNTLLKFKVNAKGLVTSAVEVEAADIPDLSSLYLKLTGGNVSGSIGSAAGYRIDIPNAILVDNTNTVSIDFANRYIVSDSSSLVATWADGRFKINYTPSDATDAISKGFADGRYLTISDYNAAQHFRGKYTTLSALNTAVPTGNDGDYAVVDAGAGSNAQNYIWDTNEGWVLSSGGGGSVTSVFGRTGVIVATAGDYDIAKVTNGTAIADMYIASASAWNAKLSAVTGTTGRIVVTGGNAIDIASTYVGQNTITTLGTISTGTWNATPIANAYIASAATWNAKLSTTTGWSISGNTVGANTGKIGTTDNFTWDAIANNLTVTRFTGLASAVNFINFQNSIATNAVAMSAAGSDTNVPFNITSKGTGSLTLSSSSTSIIVAGSGNVIQMSATGGYNFNVGATAVTTYNFGNQASATGFTVANIRGASGTATSGAAVLWNIGTNKNPTSGTASFTEFLFNYNINQTGGANGAIKTIEFNPVFQSLGGTYVAISSSVSAASNVAFIDAGTARIKTQGVIFQKNTTAESGIIDNFQMYASDIVAGNSAPHFRTENGDVVRMYSVAGWGTPSGTLNRSTYTVQGWVDISPSYSELEVQALSDHVTVLSQTLAALITDLKTGHGLLKS